MQVPFATGKKIIIAGAGISGLSFAVALRKRWESEDPSLCAPTITILERDTEDFGTQREGYSISIRSDSGSAGMQTLQKLGLLESLLEQNTSKIQGDPGAFCFWGLEWNTILRTNFRTPIGLPVPSMRIARNILRKTLLQSLSEEDHIQWGKTCIATSRIDNGKTGVYLSDDRILECDILVAADGAKSKIRSSIRPDDELSFAGPVCLMGNAKFSGQVPSPCNKDWGRVLGGNGISLFVGPIDEHSAVWSLSYRASEPSEPLKQPLSLPKFEELIEGALERGEHFNEPYQTLVRATDPATLTLVNAMDKQPFTHTGDF